MRKTKYTYKQEYEILDCYNHGEDIAVICDVFKISRKTLYNMIHRHDKNHCGTLLRKINKAEIREYKKRLLLERKGSLRDVDDDSYEIFQRR
jgi:hypothetical protein